MAFDAFARGDLDAALEMCDPKIVIQDPDRTEYRIYADREEALRSVRPDR